MWKHVGTQFPIVSVGAVMICSLLSRVWNKLGDIAAHTLRWVHQQNHGVVPVHSGTLTWRVWATNTLIIYLFGSFLKWRYPQLSSMFKWDFAWKKPSSYWGSSIYGNPPFHWWFSSSTEKWPGLVAASASTPRKRLQDEVPAFSGERAKFFGENQWMGNHTIWWETNPGWIPMGWYHGYI